MLELYELRKEYAKSALYEDCVDTSPFRQFEKWFKEASDSQIIEPNTMASSNIFSRECTNIGAVLLKLFDEKGFVFLQTITRNKQKRLNKIRM
jgi:pyridoxamine 5'-phosphate oxidase